MNKKILVIMAFFVLVGCTKRQMVRPPETFEQPTLETESKDEPSIRFKDWQPVMELATVNFDYDSSTLTDAARAKLKKNASYIKSHLEFVLLVEGYCDERGTIEYNLALGQKRAQAVREFYGQLGVALAKVGTISYGLEKPIDTGHTETAWATNRRAETKVRYSEPKQ